MTGNNSLQAAHMLTADLQAAMYDAQRSPGLPQLNIAWQPSPGIRGPQRDLPSSQLQQHYAAQLQGSAQPYAVQARAEPEAWERMAPAHLNHEQMLSLYHSAGPARSTAAQSSAFAAGSQDHMDLLLQAAHRKGAAAAPSSLYDKQNLDMLRKGVWPSSMTDASKAQTPSGYDSPSYEQLRLSNLTDGFGSLRQQRQGGRFDQVPPAYSAHISLVYS